MALLVLLVAFGAFVWLFRVPIAEAFGQRACTARGLSCTFSITNLQASTVSLENVSVAAKPGAPPVSVPQLDLSLSWQGLSPQVSSVVAHRPRLVAEFDGTDLTLGGLEAVLAGNGGSSAPLPRLDVREGEVALTTPAGTLDGTFDITVTSRSEARLLARLQPAELATGRSVLTLNAGELDLTLSDGRLAGIADLEIDTGAFGAFNAQSVLLRAEVAPAATGAEDALVYRLAARALAYGRLDAQAVTSNGTVLLDSNRLNTEDPLAALKLMSGTFAADTLRAPGLAASGLEVDLDLERSGTDDLAGPIAVTATTTTLSGVGTSDALALTGDLEAAPLGRIVFDGQVTARGMSLAQAQIDRLVPALTWPSPAKAHGEALRETLAGALDGFDTGTRLTAVRSADGALEIEARGATRLMAETGLSLAIEPFGSGPWFKAGETGMTLRGALGLTGGGAPDLTAQLNDFTVQDGALTLRLGDLDLEDWTVNDTAIGAGLSRFEALRAPGRLALSGQGALRFDGALGGADMGDLNLFGAVDAVRGSEGWRAQLGGGRCLSLAFDRMALPGLELGALTTSLCPEDGRIARQAADGSSGTLRLDAISVPFSLGTSTGDLRLPASSLDWSLSDRVTTDLSLAKLAMDLKTGPRDLSLSAGESDIAVILGGSGLEASGRLREVSFDGSLIPANASAGRFDFRLRGGGAGGLEGTADIASVRVSDYREDPLYTPMVADLSADLSDGNVRLMGPVRLEATGRHVANAEIDVSFPSVDGMIRVTGHDLEFRRGGLQPSDLSERLRGFFTDTRGALDAEARIRIDRGNLSGTGDLSVRDLGFQTVALGRVSGVNGGVFFSDLLKLQSPPGQSMTIQSIDPGLALETGRLAFQLTGGGSAALEQAVWPFAGGVLAVEPMQWNIGAERRRLTVRADRIGLAALTDTLQLPGFQAEGQVSGRFPIIFEPGHVLIQDASLLADDRGGVLRYTGGVGAQAGATNESVATAFQALENFEFTVLELGANGDLLGDVTVTARLEGRNPDVLEGSPFNFNISVDSQLGQLLTTARRLTGPDWLAQVTAERSGAAQP
ncbi:MAG: YdbH domain-containing protein [Pseudomonadota bacterium]